MKEYKIGDTFYLEDGTRLEVVKSTRLCKDCYFLDKESKHCSKPFAAGICSPCIREDKTIVVFKQVNNMEEKRNISISLEEAKEWYKAGGALKELVLKVYSEEELKETYFSIVDKVPYNIKVKNAEKADLYLKLLNTVAYVNNIYSPEYCTATKSNYLYLISTSKHHGIIAEYKGFNIHKIYAVPPQVYLATFNSEEAAKRAIDILGDELKILFE